MGRRRSEYPVIPVGLRLIKPTVDCLAGEARKRNEPLGTYLRKLLEEYAPAPDKPVAAKLRPRQKHR